MARVILWDLMDTLVSDPFFTHMAPFFGMSHAELMQAKHPTAWREFELGQIDEQQLFEKFFTDGRSFDGAAFKRHVMASYRWIEGMQELLAELKDGGVAMHVLSNYPNWYREIDARLGVSDYAPLSFVSCETGVRKPAPEAYVGVSRVLGIEPGGCLFVDDRQPNVDGAAAVGMPALRFENAARLREQLQERGLM